MFCEGFKKNGKKNKKKYLIKKGGIKNKLFPFLFLYLSLIIFTLNLWLDRYFGTVYIEQFLFFLLLGFEGLLDTDDYIINKFIQLCIFLPILIIAFLIFLNFISNKISFLYSKKIFEIISKNFLLISIFSLLISFTFIFKQLSFDQLFSKIMNKYDFISENYIKPQDIKNSNNKRNLVLIYLESFENIFSNKEIFGENLIKELDLAKHNGKTFNNFKETAYTNWTIAGIVASQCGLPLKPISILSTENKGKHQKHIFGLKTFLPNAKCLGDILEDKGYKNIFINGVDLNFVSTGLFFKDHGYSEVYGKTEYENLSLDFIPGSWGGAPHDSFLLNFSKEKLLKLKKENKLFNLTILTTDTHNPFGFLDPKCEINGEKLNDVIKCTSKNINFFINFLKEEFPNNLDIVILGDHLFPGNKELDPKIESYKRNIFNMFISKKKFELKRNYINHYDFYPTILNFMGFEFEKNRLGLGYSGLKIFDDNEYEDYIIKLNENIQNKSKFYKNFYQ